MSKWSDPKWIQEELKRKWESGRILSSLFVADELFPLHIPLKRPQSRDVNENFAEISGWIKMLRDHSKSVLGFGYELREKEMVHRQSDRNLMPTHAVIPTAEDALRLLKKNREADKFLELASMIQAECPMLRDWIPKYPLKVLKHADDWRGILAVLRWFAEHPHSDLYLRQLDIPGVDTKFIEQRKGLLAELLDIVLPEDAIDHKTQSFELRYGLRMKSARVRLRLLDPELFMQGIADMAIPVEQLAVFRPAISRVFITENEINGLCFPSGKAGMVIFGLGYSVDILKTVDWLKQKEIYYWGDIDTHGFVMLDQVRGFLPQTKSFLMNEEILLPARELWSMEAKPFLGQLTRLTTAEQRLFACLQNNTWGTGVRLEQERVAFQQVQKALALIQE